MPVGGANATRHARARPCGWAASKLGAPRRDGHWIRHVEVYEEVVLHAAITNIVIGHGGRRVRVYFSNLHADAEDEEPGEGEGDEFMPCAWATLS